METQLERELYDKIWTIIMQIREDHPELTMLLDEIQFPVHDEINKGVNIPNLIKYLDSINNILKEYS